MSAIDNVIYPQPAQEWEGPALRAVRTEAEVERLRAVLRVIDAFVNDQHRPLGDTRFEHLATMTREALK